MQKRWWLAVGVVLVAVYMTVPGLPVPSFGGDDAEASAALDAEVQKTLAAMVQAHVRAELGITIGHQ